MNDEEEAMELSGESNLVSNLHNFSFDVSWSTWSHDPSPPTHRRTDILSPAKFTHTSTPHRHWKSLTLDQHHSPTVKVSQKTCTNYFPDRDSKPNIFPAMEQAKSYFLNQTSERNELTRPVTNKQCFPDQETSTKNVSNQESRSQQSFSPMELDQSHNDFDFQEPDSSIRKRHVSHDNSLRKNLSMKQVAEISSPRKSSTARLVNHNNNIKGDSDFDDSVFVSETNNRASKEYCQPRQEGTLKEKKSSVFVLLLVVLISGCIGICLYLEVDSCSVFDIDVVKLKHKLEDNIFGQHIAVKSVLDALTKFETDVKSGKDGRTLVMTFHGWTGVGKNYISKFVAEAFYNARVSFYLIPLHFAHVDKNDGVVEGWIAGNITKCGVNVIIFDEIDKASKPLLAEVQAVIETVKKNNVDRDDNSALPIVVFIFISNSKSNQINQYLFSQLVNDRERDLIRQDEFLAIFEKSANEWYGGMKAKDLIDYYIPFFPLAESHVKQCIIKDFIKRGRDPDEELVIAVMNELSFFDMGGHNGQMSLTGCKRVHDKVDLHIDD